MKLLISLLVVSISLALVGCADQTPVTGPVQSFSTSPRGGPSEVSPPTDPTRGAFAIDQTFILAETASPFHLTGSIDFYYQNQEGDYSLSTDSRLRLFGEGYPIDLSLAKSSFNKGVFDETGTASVIDVYQLDGFPFQYQLEIEYLVAADAQLQNVRIVSTAQRALSAK